MACKYKINGVWYSEEEVKSIFEQSEKKSKEYYALVDKLDSINKAYTEQSDNTIKVNDSYTLSVLPKGYEDAFASQGTFQKAYAIRRREKSEKNQRLRDVILSELGLDQNKLYSIKTFYDILDKPENLIDGKSILNSPIFDAIKDIVVNSNVSIRFVNLNNDKLDHGGFYSTDSNTITIDPLSMISNRDNISTKSIAVSPFPAMLLHETIHAAVGINLYDKENLNDIQKEAVKKLNTVVSRLKSDNAFYGEYGITNINELLAELSDVAFVKKLKNKKFTDDKTFFEEIISAVVKLLGLDVSAYDVVEEAFTSLLDVQRKKLSESVNSDPKLIQEKQDIEAKIAELDKEFSVESKEELASTVIPETTENINTESLEIKPEVKELFESNPKLAAIGTQQQYSKYLDTIFTDSKMRDIVYHGSMSKYIESFDKFKFLSGEGANAFGQGFYFTKAKNTARFYSDSIYANEYNSSKMDEGDILAYKSMTNEERKEIFTGKIYPVLINIKKPISWEEASTEKRKELKNGEYKENDSVIHESKGFTKIHGDKEELESLLFELSNNELAIEEGNLGDPEYILTPEVKEELIIRNESIKSKIKSFSEFINGETHFIVPEPEQIHILGSKQDTEGFKEFVQGKLNNVKPEVKELFESSPELQSIGTVEQYSKYINNVFPESKVKEVVYHGADEKIEKFTLDKKKNKKEKGLFFFSKKSSAQLWRDASFEEDNTQQGDLIYALLNLKNPETIDFENKSAWDMAKYSNENIKGDGLIAINVDEMYVGRDIQYAAFKPEQIHILGNKQDIQGFKDFVEKDVSVGTNAEVGEELAIEAIPFTIKIDQFTYTLNPNTGEVIHNSKSGDKPLTNDTQINKVYIEYAKEKNLPTQQFNNQEYVSIFGKVLNVNNANEVKQEQILKLFEEHSRAFESKLVKPLPTIKLERAAREVVKPSQVLMPWKFKAKMSKYIKNGKLDMSKIDPKILTGFGMRIPNQGPNSQVAFEIVGFLPKEAGDQIITSKDLVTQMGHDFDFDTMYTYLYDSVEVNGVLTPITKELIDKILPDYNISRKQLNELIYPIKEELKEYSDILDTLNEVYIENAYSANTTDLIQKARAEKLEKELKGKLKEAKSNFSHSIKNLKELLLLKQLIDAGDTAALKNELVDTHIAVHNNPSSEVQKQIKRPIGSWILADYAKKMDKVAGERKDKELQRIKSINEEIIKENATSKTKKPLVKLPVDISPMSDLSQTTKFVSGTAGKAGVGVYSLYNTFLSVMAQKEGTNPDEQIIYKTRASQGKKGLKDWYINIGGTRSNGRLCSPYTIDGKTLKTEVAEGFQSVSVDNANDVVMDKINLNKHTFKFTVGAISLGFSEQIPRMMTQPIIFDYVAAIQNGTKVGSVARDVEKKALKEVEAKYKAILGRPITKENDDYSNKVYLQSLGDNLTVKKLDEMIALEGNSVDFALLQLSALTIFKELENVGASIQGIMGNANTDSAMLSKNLIETSAKQSLLESNLQKSTITNIDKVLGYFKGYSGDMNNLMPTTINGAATKYGLVFTNKLWNSIIPYNDPAIKKFFTATEQAFGITATSVGQLGRHRETMWSNLKSFLFTNPNLLNIEDDVVAEKNRLFIDRVADGNKAANESLSTYVSKLKQTVTKYSFLNVLESYDSKDSSKPSYLYTTDAALESADINLLYASFLDLFLNDKPLPDWNGKPYSTRRLAEDLAVGALLMGGVVNAKNYIRLIPPAYMYNIQGKNDSENYIDKLSNYVRTPNFGFLFDRVDMNAVVEQIVQNNPSMLPTKTDSDFTKHGGEYTIKEASDNMEQFVTIKRGKGEFTILARTTNGIYKELKNKDMRDFRNYNYTQASVTSPKSHIQLVDNSPKLEITPSKNIEETRDLGLKDGGKEVVDFALNMISTTSKSTYYRKLADLMKDMTKDKKIVVKTGRITNNRGEVVKGNYESSNGTTTISVNTDSNSYPMGMNELDLEESLLHELVHSISIDSYNKGKALMNQGKAGVAITTIIVSLDNLFADYQNKVKELKSQGLADNIPSNSTKDIYEFMSELFTNQDLQKLIDTMEYSKHRTLFQRFTELLEKLITALGFNLDTTTALALADIIELSSMPEVNVADTDGNTIPDGSASRTFEKYFPTITEVINKYGIFKDGIRASYTNKIDADAKVNTINSEQGVYKASVYTQSNGTFAINLVRDSRMDNVDYAYEQLTQEGRNKLNNDIC